MQTNLETALREMPKRGPRNLAEQKVIWRRKLREELEHEKRRTELLKEAQVNLWMDWEVFQNWKEHYLPGSLERSMKHYANRIDNLFFSMHRVAYFEALLNSDEAALEASEAKAENATT